MSKYAAGKHNWVSALDVKRGAERLDATDAQAAPLLRVLPFRMDFESLSLTAPTADPIGGLAVVLPDDAGRLPWWPWALALLGMAVILVGGLLFQ
jgi:hypothetical protein